MNPYYGTPGFDTAYEAFVEAIRLSFRWASPMRIWHDRDGWYVFGNNVKGTGKNIGVTYEVKTRNVLNPQIRVQLFL